MQSSKLILYLSKLNGGFSVQIKALLLGAAGLMLASSANANVTWTWNFASPTNGSYTAGGPSGFTSTFLSGGHNVTVYAAQETTTGLAESTVTGTLSTANTSTMNGLFQVSDNPNNFGQGIAPFDPTQGGSLANNEASAFNSQPGLSDDTGGTGGHLSNMLLLNVGAVTNNETLSFLLNAGVAGDSFNVWTYYGNTAPASLADGGIAMTEVANSVNVGSATNANGSVQPTSPQYTYNTLSQSGNLWVAIQADCHYLLLDQIGASQPTTTTPEPRFYGFLMAGLLALAVSLRRRFAAQA
jgi:hypothetical protein